MEPCQRLTPERKRGPVIGKDQRLQSHFAVLTLGDTQVSTSGNLTTLYSQAKTGKSTLIGAMLAATMTNPTPAT